MCLSEAGLVVTVADGRAVVDVDGITKEISLAPIVLDGRQVGPGDWVLLHTGLAVDLLDERTATAMNDFSRLVRGADQEGDR
jgi:hydrogenase expression/formation protein HypC